MDEKKILTEKLEIQDSIIRFENDIDIQKLQSLYFSKSFSEILSISRRENSHSSFIAWLLDSKESHQLSYFSLQKFLQIVVLRTCNELEKEPQSFINSILTDNYSILSVIVEKEKHLGKPGFVDIYIETLLRINDEVKKVKIIIENKVESPEAKGQTERYYKHFEKTKKAGEIVLYVYLTTISTIELHQLSEVQCSCKSFIQINYQYLVDYLLEPALNENISDNTRFMLTEYLRSLGQTQIDEKFTKQKLGLIMALGKEEKELLSNFWKKNEKLILSAMYANSINTELEQDIQELNKKTYESYFEKSGIGKEVQNSFKALVDSEAITEKELKEICNKDNSRKTFNIGQSLLLRKIDSDSGKDDKGHPRYYKKQTYQINGNEYMLCNHWTEKNIDQFRKWIKKFEKE